MGWLNPFAWAWPFKIAAAIAAALVLYVIITGLGGVVWARHVAGSAMKQIARTLSDYDKVEADSKSKEQAIQDLARQTQELEKQAADERASRVEMGKQLVDANKRANAAAAEVARLKIEDANRPRIVNLMDAAAAINKALAK